MFFFSKNASSWGKEQIRGQQQKLFRIFLIFTSKLFFSKKNYLENARKNKIKYFIFGFVVTVRFLLFSDLRTMVSPFPDYEWNKWMSQIRFSQTKFFPFHFTSLYLPTLDPNLTSHHYPFHLSTKFNSKFGKVKTFLLFSMLAFYFHYSLLWTSMPA